MLDRCIWDLVFLVFLAVFFGAFLLMNRVGHVLMLMLLF